jgi:hypothetical protein
MTSVAMPDTGRPASASAISLVAAVSLLPVLALFIVGQGTLLRMAVPAGAVLVGLVLYFRYPIGYFHFTLWTWFLTPFVRRLVDWRTGFEDHNLVLATPMLVSAIAVLTLLRERQVPRGVRLTPFFLCISAILYGFAVGIVRIRLHASETASTGEVVFALFNWLAPIVFGLHLYLHWPEYEEYKQAIQKSFLWACLLLGAYGVYQFVNPPAWDTYWLQHMLSDIGAESFGRPDAFQIRVWSTSNSPGVFANILVAGLLLLFFSKSKIKPLAVGAGYCAFLLTLVRASWLGWIVGLVVVSRNSQGRQISRILLSLLLLPALIAPLMLNPQIATIVTERLQTFQAPGQDVSLNERTDGYHVLLSSLAADPFGEGISNAGYLHGYPMDNGIIPIFCYFGWIGAAFFLAGITLCVPTMPPGHRSTDLLTPVYQAIVIAMLVELLSGNTLIGPSGAILWICIGLGFSEREAERVAEVSSNDAGTLPAGSRTASVLAS